jgi:hypothetical protein
MKMGWLLGWAIPESWFAEQVRAAFPAGEHHFFAAAPGALAQMAAAGPFDWVAGYSLGALILLLEADRAAALGQVALLAPIWAFPAEDKLGGRVARAQVRALAQWLRRDEAAAIADFYDRAGLEIPAGTTLAVPREHLLWGLTGLEKLRVDGGLPAGWRAWCGADDALIDAPQLQARVPELSLVPQATHEPARLLAAFAAAVAAPPPEPARTEPSPSAAPAAGT